MNIFTEYLNSKSTKNVIGNSLEFDSKSKKHLVSKTTHEPEEMPLNILTKYLKGGMSGDKEIAELVTVAIKSCWNNPSRARQAFTEARRIINNKIMAGEHVSDGAFYFVQFFYTIEDLTAFYPSAIETDLSEYEDGKKNNDQSEDDMDKYMKNLKKL